MRRFRHAACVLGLPAALLGSVWAHAASLYQQDHFQPLTSDTRSFRVGDALTVVISEKSSAQSEADSTATRELSLQGTLQHSSSQNVLGIDVQRSATGKGVTNRAGKLSAEISVRVQDVAANGDLAVSGSQKITINGETQMISVAGIVRPIDVAANNTVQSTRLTNSEIVYSGRGFADRNQRESWISRLFGLFGL